MSWRSNQRQVQDTSTRFLFDTNKDARCHTQLAATTLSPAEAAPIYFHNFAKVPPQTN